MKIFVDAMGGDHGAAAVVRGVSLARKEVKAKIVLLGDTSILDPLLKKFQLLTGENPVEVLHCAEDIAMGESPVAAIRSKKDSPIVKGLKLVSETEDSAFFSAGHSGAILASALKHLGRIDGVERPAIAAVMPNQTGRFILLDAGANVDCRPNHLLDFARMGSVYAKVYLKKTQPVIGILSNGEEDSKGTDLTRAAHVLLRDKKDLNYVGYVEGKEVFSGRIDVVVTDGFTGNVALKICEGLAKSITTILKSEFSKNLLAKASALVVMPFLGPFVLRMQKKLDYAEVGSAPLLGVDGLCFIGHGRSGPKAIKNGILRAYEALEMKLQASLRAEFKEA